MPRRRPGQGSESPTHRAQVDRHERLVPGPRPPTLLGKSRSSSAPAGRLDPGGDRQHPPGRAPPGRPAVVGLEGRILAKLEYFNPGSSKKDRVALEIVREGQGRRPAPPGPGRGRGHQRQHRHRPRHRLRGAGAPVRGGHVARQHHRAGPPDGPRSGPRSSWSTRGRGAWPVRSPAPTWIGSRRRPGGWSRSTAPSAPTSSSPRTTSGPTSARPARRSGNRRGGRLDAFAMIAGTCGTYTGVMRYLRRVDPRVRGYLIEPAPRGGPGRGLLGRPRGTRSRGPGTADTCPCSTGPW